MNKLVIYLVLIVCLAAIASAANVCVVVYYLDKTADSKCVNIADSVDGKAALDATGFSTLWTPDSEFGQMVCKIGGVGTDVNSATGYCEYSGDFWNFVLKDGAKWGHSPIGLNGGTQCWNRDFSWSDWSTIVHYCARDGDLIGFAFVRAGAENQLTKEYRI